MIKLLFTWVSITVFVKTSHSQLNPPLVNTSLGYVQGTHIKSYEGRTAIAFEGIPYAKPPVDNLRFKDPQPVEKWLNTLIADKTYVCMQYTAAQTIRDVVGTDDCLYLNVYVPRETITGKEDLDVVIHIHGGGYTAGDPKSFAGADYLVDRELVSVTITYRVGVLGFLSTQDAVQPGNAGLKDQVLAMKWVKDNIRVFGGNPNSITLTGSSAGSGSVHLHYLSPLSKGLFNRGFSQSGTALNMWNLSKNPVKQAKRLGEIVGCNSTTSLELLDCLRKRSAREVVLAHSNFTKLANVLPSTPFGPVIEYGPNAFLPDHPYKLLLEGRINDLPWITSNVRDEGTIALGFIILHNQLDELGNRWEELLPYVLDYEDSADELDKPFIAKSLRNYYLNDEPISRDNLNLLRLFSDRFFIVDGIKGLCLHASIAQAPVYYYYFDYLNDMPVVTKANLSVVAHGDDVRMLYRQTESAPMLSENDRKMKNIFLDFIYRYASTGIPDFKGVEWKPFNSPLEPTSYMHISSPTLIRSNRAINKQTLLFWNSLPLKENENALTYAFNFEDTLPWAY